MSEFDDVFDKMDRFFDRLFDISSFRHLPSPDGWHPPLNLYETPEDYIVIVAIPGLNRKDIDVRVDAGRLIISGTRKLPAPGRALRCRNLEISGGSFRRVLDIDDITVEDKIEARYRAGLLIVKLPKRKG